MPFSVRTYAGIPYDEIQRSKKACAINVAIVCVRGTVEVSFEIQSEITNIHWFPLCVFRREPRMYLAMNSSGPFAGKDAMVFDASV